MPLPEGILDPDEEPPFEDVESTEFLVSTNKCLYNCPYCNAPFSVTAEELRRGYMCNDCADAVERNY